jgi:hypothetical protein
MLLPWHHHDLGPDLSLPGWPSRHGPPVAVRIAGPPHYQDVLAWLRRYTGSALPIALYPEPDNPQDHNAVALIAAGSVVGYLTRDYAASWQPVVLAEHAAGRMVTGSARFTETQLGIGLAGTAIQPRRPVPGEPPAGPPYRAGRAGLRSSGHDVS